MHTVLLIDDDPELCALLEDYLGPEGFTLRSSGTGAEGLSMVASGVFDMIILDVGLPDVSGFEVLAQLRTQSQIPVVMLTGRAEDVDRIVGLEMGADDYLAKPFVPRELLARIRSVLRRSRLAKAMTSQRTRQIVADDLVLDRSSRTVQRNGETVALTFVEYTVLEMLMEAAGDIVTRDEISLKALGRELAAYDRSIDVHMSNLRKKVGSAPGGGDRIVTVRGAGYFFNQTSPWEKEDAPDALAVVPTFFRTSGGA
ncbi:response regulator transcription factor [Desulfovibrio psychrotolerans]|uniref:DNA-binding response regulator n=1 Tax=Desulfovibrio psychrotolerans TaxID=415242 RepID=A0A7J0BZ65_9BACT|nr:response regulator transcription factor [Desulfovibrio psychrotolerans]GFM38462.1 DNA-binding response regulator [Desulfovibrio psychrotolerans]